MAGGNPDFPLDYDNIPDNWRKIWRQNAPAVVEKLDVNSILPYLSVRDPTRRDPMLARGTIEDIEICLVSLDI